MTESMPAKHCGANLWVVKPSGLNRGRGIAIMRNMKEIQDYVFNSRQVKDWVIQKYIEKPLLINDRKFDIRVWALVTDDFRVYMYKEGYIRTSSGKYCLTN